MKHQIGFCFIILSINKKKKNLVLKNKFQYKIDVHIIKRNSLTLKYTFSFSKKRCVRIH